MIGPLGFEPKPVQVSGARLQPIPKTSLTYYSNNSAINKSRLVSKHVC